MSATPTVRVRIIHETNPEKYYPAIYGLARGPQFTIVGSHRYSLAKEWVRAWFAERKPLGIRTRTAFSDLLVRLRIPFIRDEVIVFGFAPWNWRLVIYSALCRRNRIIYHTSWPYWGLGETPHVYGPLSGAFRSLWLHFLRHPNVNVVCVLEATRAELSRRYQIEAEVIPHAVPDLFFESRVVSRSPGPLRLVYVGGLSPDKGLLRLLSLMEKLRAAPVTLTVIGDGQLRDQCTIAAEENSSIRFLGPIRDRAVLAREMARHDVLVLLSKRNPVWEELFGIVIIEAIAAGLGVIASDHIGPRSVLENASIGNLFAEDDAEGPEALILGLASDMDGLARFKLAHEGLADRYREDLVAARWAQILAVPPKHETP